MRLNHAKFAIALLVLAFHAPVAWGGPVFNLTSPSDFQQALDTGTIRPVTMWDQSLETIFPGEQNLFRIAQLIVDLEGLLVTVPFNGGMPLSDTIGGYSYVYGVDPDLTDTLICLTADSGGARQRLIIQIRDDEGDVRRWEYVQTGVSVRSIAPNGGAQGADLYDEGFDVDVDRIVEINYYFRGNPAGAKITSQEVKPIPEIGYGPAGQCLALLTGAVLLLTGRRQSRPAARF